MREYRVEVRVNLTLVSPSDAEANFRVATIRSWIARAVDYLQRRDWIDSAEVEFGEPKPGRLRVFVD